MMNREYESECPPETRWYLPRRYTWIPGAVYVCSVLGGLGVTALFLRAAYWWTLAMTIVGIVGVLVAHGIKVTIRRTRPFCIHCGYSLRGLPDNHRCPECGAPCSFEECRKYQIDPLRYRQQFERKQWRERTAVVDEFLEARRKQAPTAPELPSTDRPKRRC